MIRSLVVSSYAPAMSSGRGVRTYGIVRALAAHGPVELLFTPFGPPPSARYGEVHGLTLRAVPASRGPRRALSYARARMALAPEPVARGVSDAIARATAERAPHVQRIVADDVMAAVALQGLARRHPVIYSAHNLESAFRTEWGPRRRVEAFERRLIERSAETWMVSHADLAGARRLAPRARLRLVPNVVDVGAIAPLTPGGDASAALFVADFSYAPNREALGFLLDDVLPRAWARAPALRLDVVGRGLAAEEAPDPRVRFRGFVDDLQTAYAAASCAVVPLLRGGGSPLKFVEALAHGLPVVATPPAAAGLDARPGEHYLEGDGAEAFADALVDVLDPELGRRVGAAGRQLAERAYSIEALVAALAP